MSSYEQIERHMDIPKRGGEHRKSKYRLLMKKGKLRTERRKAKLDPECQATYRKYQGWEY